MSVRLHNMILGVMIVILFSVVYGFVLPAEVPVESPVQIPALSPDFWPRIITLGLILLGFIQIFYSLLRIPAGQRVPKTDRGLVRRAVAIALLLAVYCPLISILGMLTASLAVLIGCMLVYGERRPLVLVLYALLLPLGLHLFFTKVANILIPTGWLPF